MKSFKEYWQISECFGLKLITKSITFKPKHLEIFKHLMPTANAASRPLLIKYIVENF